MSTWTKSEGNIRLSEDDGPPARSFVEDEDDDDVDDDEPLATRRESLRNGAVERAGKLGHLVRSIQHLLINCELE